MYVMSWPCLDHWKHTIFSRFSHLKHGDLILNITSWRFVFFFKKGCRISEICHEYIYILVGGLEHFFNYFFSRYWEFHHPNWLEHIFQRGRSTTKQIYIYNIYVWLSVQKKWQSLQERCSMPCVRELQRHLGMPVAWNEESEESERGPRVLWVSQWG